MANFIKDLQAKELAHRENLSDLEKEINYFLIALGSEKFQGVDSEGNRKDWISTSDVRLRLQELRHLVLSGLSI
jgi:hypothetical protein